MTGNAPRQPLRHVLLLALAVFGCGDDRAAQTPADDESASLLDGGAGDGGIDAGPRSPEPNKPVVRGDAQIGTTAPSDGGRPAPAARPIMAGLQIPTDEGPVLGKQTGKSRTFLGIPYAKPPVGALRWRPPQAPEARTVPFDATEYGAICPQALPVIGWDDRGKEDCLTLNIWTPDPAPEKALPVMVYVHGGAYQIGSGGDQYDGQKLAEATQTVVVTFNYRLGALGFFTHPALSGENPAGGSGNYGLRDQQRALAWVRANISSFGGDHTNVTLFGESAGGNSVCMHLISPLSRGLFDKAIVQSGLCLKRPLSQVDSDVLGKRLEGELGCSANTDVLACLRGLDARKLTEHTALDGQYAGGIIYLDPTKEYFPQPTIDGEVLTGQPEALFAGGFFAKVPVLHGANTDEGVLFQLPLTFGGQPIGSRAEFARLVRGLVGDYEPEVEKMYAPPETANWNEALSQVSGDAVFLCASRRFAAYLERNGQPSYLYRFNAPLESLLMLGASGRAYHGADIPYLFANDFPIGTIPSDKRPLIATLQAFWARFASKGDPNGAAGPVWRPYAAAAAEEFVLDEPVSVQALTKRERCDLWQRIATNM